MASPERSRFSLKEKGGALVGTAAGLLILVSAFPINSVASALEGLFGGAIAYFSGKRLASKQQK